HTKFSRDWSSDVCSSDLGDASDGRAHPANRAADGGTGALTATGPAGTKPAPGSALTAPGPAGAKPAPGPAGTKPAVGPACAPLRSEERRVGKERRERSSP